VRKIKAPKHIHGVYNQSSFGIRDEGEAVKDYTELKKHLKSKRAKKILTHITKQEAHHKKEFQEIKLLELKIKKKRKLRGDIT